MAIIYPHFLQTIFSTHVNLSNNIPYPFFDQACIRYEALRSFFLDGTPLDAIIKKFGITEYEFKKSRSVFFKYGTCGLIGINSKKILEEEFPTEVERMVVVLKSARSWIPATKMTILLKGFKHDYPLRLIRQLYASYGWSIETKKYSKIDFNSLNLKIITLAQLQNNTNGRTEFLLQDDKLQNLLEIFRSLDVRGVTKRYPGSRVSLNLHKKDFLSIGLLGLIDRSRPLFRNSKLGFAEEGKIIISKIKNPEKNEKYWINILKTKKIEIAPTCLSNIFKRWDVDNFKSQFVGDIERLLSEENTTLDIEKISLVDEVTEQIPMRLDKGFIAFIKQLTDQPVPLSNPGLFIFLHYLNRLKIYDKAAQLMDIDPINGYSWFSLLLLNIGRIIRGISSISKACRTNEMSLPLTAGLVEMPSNDSILNGLASISEINLFQLRCFLTKAAKDIDLVEGKRIAFDFKMRDFTGEDNVIKNIGKGPSPKRKICFPGFRPHISWDLDTGTPISIEFRNGRARATTTIKRFIKDLLKDSLNIQSVEHVYLDSEYTSENVWQYVIDPEKGLGADLTMCIKRNIKVRKKIDIFLETKPTWLFFDEEHTYTEQIFEIPIKETEKILYCVLKRNEKNGNIRCFGSTFKTDNSKSILEEYKKRWKIEYGIKDLVQNYYFDNIPGIDPHRINIHYFIVTLTKILYDMFSREYNDIYNSDKTEKMLDTLRSEFISGTNAVIVRENDELIIKWIDAFPEKKHNALDLLFKRLNSDKEKGLPFLGGLKIKYEIADARNDILRNQCKREYVEF